MSDELVVEGFQGIWAMVARYTRALFGESAVEEFQRSWIVASLF